MYSARFGDKLPIMTDYTTFFGLSKEPFAPIASGTDVFVAPQVAATMAALKKALAKEDAIVAVTGPVGAGKTTVARRALESVSEFHIIVTIGRIQFGHDEVLELLLAGLGVRQLPKSTVHRFATFRRVLQQYAEQRTRVFILVEDATRVGFDALSELEAVTAADAGVSGGANLILLGDERLTDLIRDPKLARIKQRIRARQKIAAQSPGELQGYLKHCFRLAGEEFETIFAPGCCAALHSLGDGIPRITNNLVMATLSAAADQGRSEIDIALIEQIAHEEFGLTGGHNITDIAAEFERVGASIVVPEAEILPESKEPAAELKEATAAAPEIESEPELGPETGPETRTERQPEPEPEIVPEPSARSSEDVAQAAAAEPDSDPVAEDDDIPELIQDTLPDLQILAPKLLADEAAGAEPADDSASAVEPADEEIHEAAEFELPVLTGVFQKGIIPELQESNPAATETPPESTDVPDAEPAPLPQTDPEPELVAEPEPEPEPEPEMITAEAPPGNQAEDEIPAWERDPTLAQLRPDLDALERAMDLAQGKDESEPVSVLEENLAQQGETAEPEQAGAKVPDIVPEITLDKEIQAKIDEATEALKQTQADATAELETDTKDKPDRAKIASRDSQSPSAYDPQPAEDPAPPVQVPPADTTRADQELEKIASELAKAKTIDDVDDKMAETLFGEEFSMIAAEVAANAPGLGADAEVAAGTPAGETMGSVALSLEEDDEAAAVTPRLDDATNDAEIAAPAAAPDTSSSQRLQVLRDLNHTAPPSGAPAFPETTESIVMSGGGVEAPPAGAGAKVDSIEDQISTSMTQTLKALNVEKMARHADNDDDDDDETVEKKGLFGFFRRK